jgi:PAS domain S-box-containing protein
VPDVKIKTQFFLTIVALSAVVLIIISSVIVTDQQTALVDQEQDISGDIEQMSDELNNIQSRYFLFQVPEQLTLWQSNVRSILGNLSALNTVTSDQATLAQKARDDLGKLNASFIDVAQLLAVVPQNLSLRNMPEFKSAWDQMMSDQQTFASDASQLSESLRSQGDQLALTNTLLIISLLVTFGAFVMTVYIIAYRRTLKSISNLQAGINVVGSGNLDYAIRADRKDEIGELSNSFNQMTANLKTVTTSKKELEADIAERKKTEEQLEAARATLQRERNTLQSIMNSPRNIHLVYLDRDFNFVRVNSAYAKTCGYTPEEMIGKNHFELYPDLENEIIFKRVRETGVAAQFQDKPFVFPDQPERGVTYWDWTLEAIKDAEGKVEGLVFALVETTERKRLQDKLEEDTKNLEGIVEERTKKLALNSLYARGLIEASLDPLVTISLEGKITDVNKATEQVTGYPREDLIGTDFSSYFTEPEKAQIGYKRVFTEGFAKDYPLTIKHRSGRNTDVLYNAAVYKNETGDVQGVFAAARDVTELRKAEEQARESARKLKDSERLAAIGATAAMVGHDIRNPLQAITGDIYLLRSEVSELPEGEAKGEIRESLGSIDQSVQYVNKIVQDLQDFARPITPVAKEINLQDLCEDVLLKSSMPEKVRSSCSVDKGAKQVVADPDLLRRVISNLVSNAVQAMPKGGKLVIRAHRYEGDTVIEVQDSGVGIPEDVKPRLFTPLFTTKSKGQGFGLAVVKRVVESMNGTVTFESKEGKGTLFVIRLPPPTK